MIYSYQDYCVAALAVKARIGEFRPEIAMILGSGLGDMAELLQDSVTIPFEEIPGFRSSTAPGHAGVLVFGTLCGKAVAVMKGRFHYYEGYSYEEIGFPVRVLKLLGAEKLLITNASGGINLNFQVGDICLITDHIKLFPESPLRGKNLEEFGPRFCDSTYLYTPRLQEVARQVASEQGIGLQEGVYMIFAGPSYETPAEIRMARMLGADLAGMSTVPEVLTAAHAGMEVLGFSLVSNAAAGVTGEKLSEEEVLAAGVAAKEKFSRLISGCVEKM